MTTMAQSFVGRRFRFERFWLKLEGFADVVKGLWDDPSGDVPADPLRRLQFKLRRTSRGLQSWSQRKVGYIRDLILVANEVVSRLDVAQEGRQLSVEERDLRRGLKLKVLGLASLERTISRQRARVAGIAEGDASSKFFRIMASARRSHNSITALRSGEQVVTDLPGKVELATDYFMRLLGTAQPRDFGVSLQALGLQPLDLSALEGQFSEAEIWAAICAMPTNKSPGPDGFSWEFYRHCWPIIKVDVLAALREVWLGRDQGFEGLNEALITLLPKKEGAVDLKDFRPISLVHSFARLLTKATVSDLQAVWSVLDCFGAASGLKANPAKSTAAPIGCSDDLLAVVAPSLPCPLGRLPCSYLGLPLSIRKPRKAELQALLDKLAAKLPFWKARLMTREGRLVYVQAVMTASVVYHLLALDVDPWFIKAVDKLRRGFFWAGKDDARGGCCMVAWHLVCQPKSLGGLGLHNLRWLNVALRTRWLWLQRSDGSEPWQGMDVRVSGEARALFDASVRIEVGSGATVRFWEDAWIGGLTARAIAPDLVKLVRVAVRRQRSVQEGLPGNAWAADIAGELSVAAVVQYLHLWAAIAQVPRSGAAEDQFSWKWSNDGQFSPKSAYRMLWHGTCGLPGATLVWDSFAPLQYKLHAWLALRRRCWTADRRLRRGLPTHTLCPLSIFVSPSSE
ncbi:hypothetical protein ACQ4PT_065657 [Festuca glaucescens]